MGLTPTHLPFLPFLPLPRESSDGRSLKPRGTGIGLPKQNAPGLYSSAARITGLRPPIKTSACHQGGCQEVPPILACDLLLSYTHNAQHNKCSDVCGWLDKTRGNMGRIIEMVRWTAGGWLNTVTTHMEQQMKSRMCPRMAPHVGFTLQKTNMSQCQWKTTHHSNQRGVKHTTTTPRCGNETLSCKSSRREFTNLTSTLSETLEMERAQSEITTPRTHHHNH